MTWGLWRVVNIGRLGGKSELGKVLGQWWDSCFFLFSPSGTWAQQPQSPQWPQVKRETLCYWPGHGTPCKLGSMGRISPFFFSLSFIPGWPLCVVTMWWPQQRCRPSEKMVSSQKDQKKGPLRSNEWQEKIFSLVSPLFACRQPQMHRAVDGGVSNTQPHLFGQRKPVVMGRWLCPGRTTCQKEWILLYINSKLSLNLKNYIHSENKSYINCHGRC